MNPSSSRVLSSSSDTTTADILLELVQNPKNIGWTKRRKGWEEKTDVCQWDGITCNQNHQITTLNLENTNLVATIPPSLRRLTSLQHLLLANNKIYGTLPPSLFSTSFGGGGGLLSTTSSLLFGGNDDDDDDGGGGEGLRNLVSCDLSFNGIRGSIPRMRIETLEVLNLSNNQLSGILEEDAFDGERLTNLKILDLVNNYLGGTLPNSLTTLTTLVELNLSKNRFHGSIPDGMGELSNLEGLFLNDNEFVGSIPLSLTREYLPLRQIFLHSNHLSGSLPVTLADLKHLENLFIVGNKFTGTIPNELCQKKLNAIFSHNTDDDDGCHAIACPTMHRSLNTDRNGIAPCIPCDDGSHQMNPYLGSDSCYDVDPEVILNNFYYSTNGENWDSGGDDGGGGETWVDRNVSLCGRKGLICDSSGNVVEIRLENMNLSGTIPEDLGFLRHLKVINLSDNNLYGTIPSSLQFPPLAILDISGNKLKGFVPPQLCSKTGINQNGHFGIHNCDIIACPIGTHHAVTGRAPPNGGRCYNCRAGGASYLGSRTCDTPPDVVDAPPIVTTGHDDADTTSLPSSTTSPPMVNVGIVLVLLSIVAVGTITYVLYSLRKVEKEETFEQKKLKRLSVVAPSQLRQLSFAIPSHPQMSISVQASAGRQQERQQTNRVMTWMDSLTDLDMVNEIDCETDPFAARGGDGGAGRRENNQQKNKQVWLDVPKFN